MVHKRKRGSKAAAVDRSGLEAKEEASDAESTPETAAKADPPAGAWKKTTEDERQQATQRAIEVIKKGLKEHPEVQKEGKPFLPLQWAKEFKPILGPYRKFVEKCNAFVIKSGDLPSLYTIHPQEDASALVVPDKQEWEFKMAKTWETYLHNVKKEDRKPEEFVEFAKNLARQCVAKADGETRGQYKKRKAKAQAALRGEGKEEAKATADAQEEPPKKKAKVRAVEEEAKVVTDAPAKKLKKKKQKAAA